MKKVVVLLAFLSVFAVGCMSFKKTDPILLGKPFQYTFSFDSMKKDVIYDKSLAWFAETYNSANDVLQLKDKTNGKIIGRGVGEFYCAMYIRKYTYTAKLEIKDSKARLSFDSYKPMTYMGSNPMTGQSLEVGGLDIDYQDPYDLTKTNFDALSAKYEKYIKAEDSSF